MLNRFALRVRNKKRPDYGAMGIGKVVTCGGLKELARTGNLPCAVGMGLFYFTPIYT